MNILMCGNDRAIVGMETTIYSTMAHNKNVNWYIFTMDITVGDIEYKKIDTYLTKWMTKIVKYFDSNSTVTVIDVKEQYNKYLAGGANEDSFFTPYTGLRLLADVVLPEEVRDILYLDCDVIVQENIESMYYFYLSQGKPFAAVRIEEEDGTRGGDWLCGVILLNLNLIRQLNLYHSVRKTFFHNKYQFTDQDAFNAVIDDKYCTYMDKTYDYMWEYEKANREPAILHFTNKLEPKIYLVNPEYFYRRFPHLTYIRDGLNLIHSITRGE